MMKKFTIALLSTVFVALMAGSVQSVSADHFEPDQELIKDSKYKLHVQVVVRNTDNQLLSITETTGGVYIPHKITDDAFDTFMGKKKIVTIDGIKYEKVQFYDSYTKDWDADYPTGLASMIDRSVIGIVDWDEAYPTGLWVLTFCEEINIEFECFNIFQVRSNQVVVEGDDVITAKWTILRAMN